MRIAVALALGLVTTACGQQSKSSTEALQTFDVAEAPAPPSPSAPKGDPAAAQRLKVAVPQMAYV